MRFDPRLAVLALGVVVALFLLIALAVHLKNKRIQKVTIQIKKRITPPPLPPRPIEAPTVETHKEVPKEENTVCLAAIPIAPTLPKPVKVKTKYKETEKRRAKRAIEITFKGFFYAYLGNKSFKGILNHPGNIEPGKLNIFRESRIEEIGRASLEAKAKLMHELKKEAAILEDKKIESALHELCQKLIDVSDLFTFNEKFQNETLQLVNDILKKPAKE